MMEDFNVVQKQKCREGYVGFVNLPNQVYRKSLKKVFEFTLMTVGESGLGKSTLVNSLFLTDVYSPQYPGPSHRIKRTVQVEHTKVLLKEGDVQLLLTIVDTPGFGDAVDNSNCWQPVINYIDSKFEDYLNAECLVNRQKISDKRVHCCLYFIAPSGHGLKPLDIEFMKRLQDKVNIIPVIAKSDMLICEECQNFKKQIMKEIQEHKIKIYEFPETDDEEENKLIRKMKDRLPFAVIGSNNIIDLNGKKVRGRQYPWGVAEGESGLGKSTLINSLFLTDVYSPEYPGPSHRIKKTVQVEQTKVLLREGCVQLLLTIVDTPGFGDAIDNSNCWHPVAQYIDCQFEDYLRAESEVNRRQMPDNRVNCCLYFIAPSGHGLKPLDIEFLKCLQDKVNIIPLIAKADMLPPEECQQFKKQIMKEIQEHKIKIYEIPETDDEEENKIIRKIKCRLPFAVIGSNTIIEVNGKRVRGRQYPWGVAEVENCDHCDFTILRNVLIRTHMQDLKDVTNNVHYENYRSRKLASISYKSVESHKNKGQLPKCDPAEGLSPLAQMDKERREHVVKMKKMEMEMEQVFEMKVKEKVKKLKEAEAELQRRHEQMKKNIEAQHRELEGKRRQFEDDKAHWEAQQRTLEQQNAPRAGEKKKKGSIF